MTDSCIVGGPVSGSAGHCWATSWFNFKTVTKRRMTERNRCTSCRSRELSEQLIKVQGRFQSSLFLQFGTFSKSFIKAPSDNTTLLYIFIIIAFRGLHVQHFVLNGTSKKWSWKWLIWVYSAVSPLLWQMGDTEAEGETGAWQEKMDEDSERWMDEKRGLALINDPLSMCLWVWRVWGPWCCDDGQWTPCDKLVELTMTGIPTQFVLGGEVNY